MKVVIAGAGIGGLTTALCLAKAGHDIHLVESSPAFLDIGAGIQCGANALCVMQTLGVLDRLTEVAVTPKRVEFRDYQSGLALHTMVLGQSYQEKYGAPYLHLHRSDLHSVLLGAFLNIQPNGLTLDTKVLSYKEHDNLVKVELSNGDSIEADLLVAADGINSVIRKQLLGNTPATFTGNVAWRGVVPVERLPDNWMDTVVSNFVGPNKHMVLYYLRQQRLANFVGVVENKTWTDSSWSAKAPWQDLSADFKGWHPTVRSIIDAVDKDSCYRWALYNHQPFSNWSSNRVTLLGDAAHSTLPFMASGAAMAIEDGRILQRAIEQASSLPEGLQLYQRNRFERTAKIQTTSARAGKLYHFKTSLMRKAAFTVLDKIGARHEAYLPDYDANTVKLV
ncbi:MAG: salicylate hydroxylase [Arenicella sp.]|jgi:salicylate hydroxylase